jgi:hypothetical protein
MESTDHRSKIIAFRLTLNEHRRLMAYSKKHNLSVSDIIRKVVPISDKDEECCNTHEKA